jgi:hypothetical protein
MDLSFQNLMVERSSWALQNGMLVNPQQISVAISLSLLGQSGAFATIPRVLHKEFDPDRFHMS